MAGEAEQSTTLEKTSSGIPEAEFVEDVEEFMKRTENESADKVLRRLEEQHSKYKFMEYNFSTKKTRLKSQIPDIRASLNIVKHMQSRKERTDPMETHFQMSDNLYVKAKVPPTDKVCLWLGANVMLEYTLSDAQNLLAKNLEAAVQSLEQLEDDLGFLRDQTTTIEVNMARVYNWDVKRRQAAQGTTPQIAS